MTRTPESIRAAAARNRLATTDQLRRAQPLKLQSAAARQSLQSARDDNAAGLAALQKMKHLKHIPGFFPTPPKLALLLIERALAASQHASAAGLAVLEPEAGKGDIAGVAHTLGAIVDCYEINHDLRRELQRLGLHVVGADFMLAVPTKLYDIIVMNPPFERHQDRAHIRHAFDFLKPGGVLAAIASAGAISPGTGAGFRHWLGLDESVKDKDVTIWENEDGAFAGSDSERQTNVRTVMIRIVRVPPDIKQHND